MLEYYKYDAVRLGSNFIISLPTERVVFLSDPWPAIKVSEVNEFLVPYTGYPVKVVTILSEERYTAAALCLAGVPFEASVARPFIFAEESLSKTS